MANFRWRFLWTYRLADCLLRVYRKRVLRCPNLYNKSILNKLLKVPKDSRSSYIYFSQISHMRFTKLLQFLCLFWFFKILNVSLFDIPRQNSLLRLLKQSPIYSTKLGRSWRYPIVVGVTFLLFNSFLYRILDHSMWILNLSPQGVWNTIKVTRRDGNFIVFCLEIRTVWVKCNFSHSTLIEVTFFIFKLDSDDLNHWNKKGSDNSVSR